MKKQLLYFILITIVLPVLSGVSNIVSAQIVNIPNANFKAALVGNSSINTNADAEIQVSEAAAFTGKISVNLAGISDMTGIEAFTALDSLSCYFNSLTSLNISACTALRYLDCDYNQLTSLNVSSNTALTGLNCTNNPLTALNVSSNTALVALGCGGNKITSLDVSNNIALTTLVCFYDSITSLDVSALIHLTYFDCSYNKLTNLNMQNGNNSNLTGFNAKYNAGLGCIQVDNIAYMNTNWTNAKDAGASYNLTCLAGMEEIPAYEFFSIYPNPSHSSLTISLNQEPGIRSWELEICNMLGEKVYSEMLNTKHQKLNTVLAPGIYFVRVKAVADSDWASGEDVYAEVGD